MAGANVISTGVLPWMRRRRRSAVSSSTSTLDGRALLGDHQAGHVLRPRAERGRLAGGRRDEHVVRQEHVHRAGRDGRGRLGDPHAIDESIDAESGVAAAAARAGCAARSSAGRGAGCCCASGVVSAAVSSRPIAVRPAEVSGVRMLIWFVLLWSSGSRASGGRVGSSRRQPRPRVAPRQFSTLCVQVTPTHPRGLRGVRSWTPCTACDA